MHRAGEIQTVFSISISLCNWLNCYY
jgi:hypothetical protein